MVNQSNEGRQVALPKIEKIFGELEGSQVFTTLDLFSGYWQIHMDESCKEMTIFLTRYGTYQFEVMPFGLMDALDKFQKVRDGKPPRYSFRKSLFV